MLRRAPREGRRHRLLAQARRHPQGPETGEPALAVFKRRLEAKDNRLRLEQHP